MLAAAVAITDAEQNVVGSGIAVAEDIVVTALHVVNTEEGTLFVALPEQQRLAGYEIVGVDVDHDLALLRVSGLDLTPMSVADEESPGYGDTVYAVGFPTGSSSPVVTRGVVSAPRRSVDGVEYIQIDASINPGSSGGAVVSESGSLLGISVAKIAAEEIDNVGFVIPVEKVSSLLATSESGDWSFAGDNESAEEDVDADEPQTRSRSTRHRSRSTSGVQAGEFVPALVAVGLLCLLAIAVVSLSKSGGANGGAASSSPDGQSLLGLRINEAGAVRDTLIKLPAVVGRSSGADIVLRDPTVSRLHARLDVGPDGLVRIVDLDSSQGVFMDGVRVIDTAFSIGGTARLGHVTLVRVS